MNCVILGPTIEEIKESGKITDIDAYVHEAAHFLAHVFQEIFIIPDTSDSITSLIAEEYKRIYPKGVVTEVESIKDSNNILCFGLSIDILKQLASAKTDQQDNANAKIFIDERCISSRLPKEIEEEIGDVKYFDDFHVVAGEVR